MPDPSGAVHPTDAAWLLPAAKELYAHRKAIASIWRRIVIRLSGKRTSIAVTGMSGAGKTVLLDHLTGQAMRAGYSPPGRSTGMEQGAVRTPGVRIGLAVVPGQASTPRVLGLEELFSDDPGIDGVVHVVANGYLQLGEDARAIIAEMQAMDLGEYLAYQRTEELRDLQEVLYHMHRSVVRRRRPKWLLVALAKYDLYYQPESAGQVIGRYASGADSGFASAIEDCRERVGRDNLRWSTVPVSAYLDEFTWPGGVVRPQLTEPERDHFLARFAAELERYCGS